MMCSPVIHPTAPPVEEIDNIIDEYKIQSDKVIEDRVLIQSKKEFLKERKESERTKIVALFSNILDILADKEARTLCKLDERYKTKEDKLDELLTLLENANKNIKTEAIVAERIKAGDSSFKDVTLADIKSLLCNIKTGVEVREEKLREVLRDSDTPIVELNDEVINVVNALDYVKLTETNNRGENENNDDEGAVANEQDSDHISEAVSGHVSVTESTEERHEDEVEGNSEEYEGNILESGITEHVASDIDSLSHEQVDIAHPTPSAPLQPQEEEEPPPPPYWQAIGLSGPAATDLPRSPVPSSLSSDVVPPFLETTSSGHHSNELVFSHNFLLKRQYDARAPKPVALTWNFDKICVADRANSKVKVFTTPDGTCRELYLGGCEIYDMAFIEKYGNEHKYVVTIPRAKTLIFISAINVHSPHISLKLKLSQGYTSIAKGTRVNTLVGADALSSSGEPRVDILTIQGQILRTFENANLSYPRCVTMFNQAIIVADWKLNSVAVLLEDGRTIAQYGGTANFPLKEPSSLTLDQFGNVMIVDGKTGNIHVTDLQCRPLEIIKCQRGHSVPKLISFDTNSHQLAVIIKSGDIAIYDFKGGYQTNSHNTMMHMFQPHPLEAPSLVPEPQPVVPEPLPVVPEPLPVVPEAVPGMEGMLPSTIANIHTG